VDGSTPATRNGAHVAEAEFRALYTRLRHDADRGVDDRLGALNNLAPQHRLAALREVRARRSLSLAAPIETERTADNPSPCQHTLNGPATGAVGDADGLTFAADSVRFDVHGNADSHIDALRHVVFDGQLYNGVPASQQTLFVRVGHRRGRELGPWDAAATRVGLHPQAMLFAGERRIAVLGSDGNNDTAPSLTAAVDFPVHVLAINAMGLYLLDYLQLNELAAMCAERGSWAFLCSIAPLRLPAATGSPVNPLALL